MHEHLLQFIWNELLFDFRDLKTVSGKSLIILNNGTWNFGDGPDFRQAVIEVDNIRFYGDVELHLESELWFSHHHDTDYRYNNVILHVVLGDRHYHDVKRSDGTTPFGLILEPYLTERVHSIIRKMAKPELLPCAGSVTDISRQVINQQLDKSASEYFQAKVDEWTGQYDADLEPSQAIQRLLALSLFDGLGISRNRKSMRHLFRLLIDREQEWKDLPLTDQIGFAMSSAGISGNPPDEKIIQWDFSGSRPANHPGRRIPQAMALLKQLTSITFDQYFYRDPEQLWQDLTVPPGPVRAIGKQRSEILFKTCYLPVLYLCGSVYQNRSLMQQTVKLWKQTPFEPDPAIIKPFLQSGFPDDGILRNIGTVYQLKNYCRSYRCDRCIIMKTILLS